MAKIKYNGKTLAEITTGQSITLHTDGHELEGDLVIEGFNGGGSCSGNHVIEVTELPETGVKGAIYKLQETILTDLMATLGQAQISVLVFYEALLGVAPTIYNIHSLDEIAEPKEFPLGIYFVIPEKKVYQWKADGSGANHTWTPLPDGSSDLGYVTGIRNVCYEWVSEGFRDVIVVAGGQKISVASQYGGMGVDVSFNTIPTETTEGIKVSTLAGDVDTWSVHLYYIEDANDVFVYGDVDNSGTNKWVPMSAELGTFNGFIADENDATAEGCYALGGTPGWIRYGKPSGRITVIENNTTVDVTDFASVTVKLPEYGGTVVYE